MNSNCSNFLDRRNLQEQVKKVFCYIKLFWPFTVWINCFIDLKTFLENRTTSSHSRSEQFGQQNTIVHYQKRVNCIFDFQSDTHCRKMSGFELSTSYIQSKDQPLYKINWRSSYILGNFHRLSTCPLVSFSWLLDHVIYLKLIKKWLFFKLTKFTK